MDFWRFSTQESNLIEELHASYDLTLVLLSIIIASLAAHAAFAVVDRITSSHNSFRKGRWLMAGAITMGCGIWAMHFTAMLAHELPIEVSYNLWITVVSVVPAILASGVALRVLSQKSTGLKAQLLGGLLMAIGIGTMHYLGMEAIVMQAELRYDFNLFALSIVVAFLLSSIALNVEHLIGNNQARFTHLKIYLRAIIMGVAVAGMHYTAMAASRIYPVQQIDISTSHLPSFFLGLAIFLSVALIISLTLVGTHVDRRLDEAEDSLRESMVWADKIIDTVADGIISMDDQGILLSINCAAERIFGYPEQELVGRSVKILMPDADWVELDGHLTLQNGSDLTGESATYREVIASHGNGHSFPLEIGLTEMTRNLNRVFIGTMRDITRRKNDENALRSHARQQAIIAELGQYAVLERDLDKVFNLTVEKLAGVPGNDFCEVLELMPDGNQFLLRAGVGWQEGLVGSALVETDAIESQVDFTLLSKDPVVVENLTTDKRFNGPELLRKHEIKGGISVRIIISGATYGVLGVHCKEPRSFSVEDVSLVVAVANMLSPIIEKYKMENQRSDMERQLAQAQKLESIGHLAAGVAHEINTPTQFVGDNIRFLETAFRDLYDVHQAYDVLLEAARKEVAVHDEIEAVENALRKADSDFLLEEIPKAIEQSIDGVSRIAKIVGAMKAFSHPGSDKKELSDLNAAISNTITVASNEWKYVAEMKLDLEEDLPMAPCFPAEFNQVVLNLVVNAAHAIKDVIGNCENTKGMISVSTRQLDENIEVRIRDTGNGIPEDLRERIFDPFFTTKEVGKGTGQGLSIAHASIVDKHHGSLKFETEIGVGTTFIITIPLEDSSENEVPIDTASAG